VAAVGDAAANADCAAANTHRAAAMACAAGTAASKRLIGDHARADDSRSRKGYE
jgi:hypothetical protein